MENGKERCQEEKEDFWAVMNEASWIVQVEAVSQHDVNI